MSIKDDFEIGLLLGGVALVVVVIYYAKDWFQNASCIAHIGAIPGITGATKAQVQAAATANCKLHPGGKTIWSCGSDFDYLQPCGNIVTEVRHSLWCQITGTPNSYTDVPIAQYVPPSGGVTAPACTNSQTPAVICCGGEVGGGGY